MHSISGYNQIFSCLVKFSKFTVRICLSWSLLPNSNSQLNSFVYPSNGDTSVSNTDITRSHHSVPWGAIQVDCSQAHVVVHVPLLGKAGAIVCESFCGVLTSFFVERKKTCTTKADESANIVPSTVPHSSTGTRQRRWTAALEQGTSRHGKDNGALDWHLLWSPVQWN